jgi:hypothetical protein
LTGPWWRSPTDGPTLARLSGSLAYGGTPVTLTLPVILALIALVCGILMLVTGRWSKFPLAAIAIICLALIESGLLGKIQ